MKKMTVKEASVCVCVCVCACVCVCRDAQTDRQTET